MTNLFSVFDPVSSLLGKLNWVALMLGVSVLPTLKYLSATRSEVTFLAIFKTLNNEMKALLSFDKTPAMVIFLALFFLVLFNNLLGLVPYVFTATSHLAVTLSLSLPLWLGYYTFGWVTNFKWMVAHLVPQGTPNVLMPFMVLIESISSLIRPLTLSVRLAANMIAGHLLLTLMSSSIEGVLNSTTLGVISAQVMLVVLEAAVAVIQSYVLVILSVLYASEV